MKTDDGAESFAELNCPLKGQLAVLKLLARVERTLTSWHSSPPSQVFDKSHALKVHERDSQIQRECNSQLQLNRSPSNAKLTENKLALATAVMFVAQFIKNGLLL